MQTQLLNAVAQYFGFNISAWELLEGGLINESYRVETTHGKHYLLQQINTTVFKNPSAVTNNYLAVYNHCKTYHYFLPKPIAASNGNYYYESYNQYWRCLEFIENSYSTDEAIASQQVENIAKNFAVYANTLQNLSPAMLQETIPNFHNLAFRYEQYLTAKAEAINPRISAIENTLEEFEYLVQLYNSIKNNPTEFPQKIYHHDAKGSNILLNKQTHLPICVIDLDTTMPGYFFSDVGDMVRSLAFTYDVSESHATANFSQEFYEAILNGYSNNTTLTNSELLHINKAGLLIIYMQALRFYTDYLQGNTYYKTSYATENLQRTQAHLQALKVLQALDHLK